MLVWNLQTCPIGNGLTLPTFTEAVTVFVAVSITETLLLPEVYHIYLCSLRGDCNSARIDFPTSTVGCNLCLWLRQSQKHRCCLKFATYAFFPSGLTATPQGPLSYIHCGFNGVLLLCRSQRQCCCWSSRHRPFFHRG